MYAERPNPIAATLEKLRVGQRSGVRPVRGSVLFQNQRKVRTCTVSRNGSFREALGAADEAGAVSGPVVQATVSTAATVRTRAARRCRAALIDGVIRILGASLPTH